LVWRFVGTISWLPVPACVMQAQDGPDAKSKANPPVSPFFKGGEPRSPTDSPLTRRPQPPLKKGAIARSAMGDLRAQRAAVEAPNSFE
jgi:hypothetical protein